MPRCPERVRIYHVIYRHPAQRRLPFFSFAYATPSYAFAYRDVYDIAIVVNIRLAHAATPFVSSLLFIICAFVYT